MFEDVISFHEGLVQDVVGRAWVSQDLLKTHLSRLQPLTLINYLKELYEKLRQTILRISRQPSTRLIRRSEVVRYRGGELLDAASVSSIARWSETEIDENGQLQRIGRVRVRKHTLTEDLSEHRHIAAEIRRLSRKAFELSKHCRTLAALLQKEKAFWGREKSGNPSIFQEYYMPRIDAYEALSNEAHLMSRRFNELLTRFSFLRNLSKPRTIFGPTPIFMGRPDYRKIYHLLLQTRKQFGILLHQDAMLLQYRDFPTLYEVWCLVQIIRYLQQRFGSVSSLPSISEVNDIYLPTVEEEQTFLFKVSRNIELALTYQHQFLPWRQASKKGERWGASFSSEPLRPDITLTIHKMHQPPVILVIDAKSTDYFRPIRFREMADYSRQVFDLRDGSLPIKQVFLLHRDRTPRSPHNMTNIPSYLIDKETPKDTFILGAIPLLPELEKKKRDEKLSLESQELADDDFYFQAKRNKNLLASIIDKFLFLYGDIPVAKEPLGK